MNCGRNYEAAFGLEYLHARGILHRDLTCDNILAGSDNKAKLTDFGLSAFATAENQGYTSGAIRWVVPECLGDAPASDIYSLEMCIIQAVSGNLPWGSNMLNPVVKQFVKEGKLPPRPDQFNDEQWELVKSMCKSDPSKRLDILVVVSG
ncbi:hypothetical protein V7S43_014496 [Phytophthora oleae]|uniref:Protein kinase domain-containing protein n=1 Tax=Phytophthora oleae TaxID=2107226 RepID=A0ABD3F1I1_9STRA